MKAQDIEAAAIAVGKNPFAVCTAFTVVLPVLQELARKQGFIMRLVMGAVNGVIAVYVSEKCG